jgi:hypothetical protein
LHPIAIAFGARPQIPDVRDIEFLIPRHSTLLIA